MANRLDELKKDLAELDILEKQAVRQKNKDLISIAMHKLTSEIQTCEEQLRNPSLGSTSSSTCLNVSNRRYEVKISNYAWDQTDKHLKFYVTLKNVHTIPQENVKCEFAPKNLHLQVLNLDGKDHVLKINSLLQAIDPEKSSWKVKTDMVVVTAAKVKPEIWSHVTEFEKKSSDLRTPKVDDSTDPGEGLMSLMKNMYSSGDDEMKRTIAKAWHESQMKGNQFM